MPACASRPSTTRIPTATATSRSTTCSRRASGSHGTSRATAAASSSVTPGRYFLPVATSSTSSRPAASSTAHLLCVPGASRISSTTAKPASGRSSGRRSARSMTLRAMAPSAICGAKSTPIWIPSTRMSSSSASSRCSTINGRGAYAASTVCCTTQSMTWTSLPMAFCAAVSPPRSVSSWEPEQACYGVHRHQLRR